MSPPPSAQPLPGRTALGALAALLIPLALLLPGDGAGDTLPAPPAAACGSGALSVGDAQLNPPTGGDKDFFSIQSGPPTVMLMLGNNYRMQNFVTTLPADGTATGCGEPIASGMTWYDPRAGTSTYDPDFALFFFNPNFYYVSYSDHLPIAPRTSGPPTRIPTDPGPYSLDSSFQSTRGDASPDAACAKFFPAATNASEHAACVACLANVGWYRGSPDPNGPQGFRWVLKGNALNQNPPKFVVARRVVKDILGSLSNTRVGVAIYGPDQGAYDPALLLAPVQPTCDKSFPVVDQTALENAKLNLIMQINRITFDNLELGMGEALFSLGGYFSSQTVDGRWSRWFTNGTNNPVNAPEGYPGNDFTFNGKTWPWTDGPDTWVKGPVGGSPGNPGAPPPGTPPGLPGAPFEPSDPHKKSVCWACQNTAIIFITDAVPDNDNTVPASKMLQLLVGQGARNPDGSLVTFSPGTPTPGGINYCDRFGGTLPGCDFSLAPQGPDPTNKNFADDVAFFLAHMDLRDDYGPTSANEGLDRGQRVRTYTIGFGVAGASDTAFLKSIASAGQGRYYSAGDGSQLKTALQQAINDVRQSSTSFSSANLTPVQASGQQFAAYVPRLIPHGDRPYEGHLYRFQYYSEFVEGCDPAKAASAGGDPYDLDKDGTCNGVFLLDRPAGYTLQPGHVPPDGAFTADDIVQEAEDGTWVKVKTATVDPLSGKLVGGQPASPFWDASAALAGRSASSPCPGAGVTTSGGRCIYTLIDRNNDGRFDDADNPPVEFIRANDAQLQPYLLSGGTDACHAIFDKLGRSWTGSAADLKTCTDTIIDFIRGVDVFDYDGDKNVTENRPCPDNDTTSCLLGDLFHSSPIVVDPPVDPFLCDLGLHNQCLRTLYTDYAAIGKPPVSEQVCTSGGPTPCYQATPMNPPLNLPKLDYGAYGQYMANNGTRDRFILVGANDGMLHAFHAGSAIAGKTRQSAVDDIYDLGTGQEMWAFIPPDLLPKLGLLTQGHQYMVDGTPMVRDIWVDGSATGGADGVKQSGEFHTVAILSERSGGSRYLALDVTDPWAMVKGGSARPFRWMFPQPLDPESARVGESWSSFAPKPPPIGPVRLANAGNARGWDERWIVLLNGGYSADLTRGRGVYMLDAWTGGKLWSFTTDLTLSGMGDSYRDRVENLMMPVAATPALVDVGQAGTPQHDADGFFDTATVGDLGGQMWTFRFFQPGQFAGGQVTNWYGARALEMDRQDVAATATRNLATKEPFFNLASNTLQPETGWLRTFAGTGDRQHLKETGGNGCSPSNLLACTRLKCDASITVGTNVNGFSQQSQLTIKAGQLIANTTTVQPGSAVAAAPACVGAALELRSLSLSCPAGSSLATNGWSPAAFSTQSTCTDSSRSYSCNVAGTNMDAQGDLAPTTTSLPWDRFYGFYSYGGADRTFSDRASALAFDSKRVTDKAFACGATTGCALKDVTLPSSAFTTVVVNGQATQVVSPTYDLSKSKAGATDPGWFLRYDSLDEKTGAGAAVLGGIVFWPTFLPAANTSGPCAASTGDVARSWQADIITGAPDQAEGFKVYNGNTLVGFQQSKSRGVSSPPPEPATVISLSKTGQVRYGISVMDPGSNPVQETLRSKSTLAADVYVLPVSRSVHLCRHQDASACK